MRLDERRRDVRKGEQQPKVGGDQAQQFACAAHIGEQDRVERTVEANVRRRMDDDLDGGGEQRPIGGRQAQTEGGHVTVDGVNAVHVVGILVAESFEQCGAEDVANAFGRGALFLRAQQNVESADIAAVNESRVGLQTFVFVKCGKNCCTGISPQQFLHEQLAQHARCSGQEDDFVAVEFLHGRRGMHLLNCCTRHFVATIRCRLDGMDDHPLAIGLLANDFDSIMNLYNANRLSLNIWDLHSILDKAHIHILHRGFPV